MSHCSEEKDKQALSESFEEMNAIARGVEIKLDLITDRSEIVTQRTIDIARQFSIPEKEIQKWTVVKTTHDSKINRVIKSILSGCK